MNIFFLIEKEGGGGVELVTSPLDAGDILDGKREKAVAVGGVVCRGCLIDLTYLS